MDRRPHNAAAVLTYMTNHNCVKLAPPGTGEVFGGAFDGRRRIAIQPIRSSVLFIVLQQLSA